MPSRSPRAYHRGRSKTGVRRIRRWVSLLALLFAAIFILINKRGLWRLHSLRQETVRLEAELAQLRQSQSVLEKEKTRLENDLVYIEQLARERYRMVKKGEKAFRVMSPADTASQKE